MPKYLLESNPDQCFHALADATRRAVIERLALGSASVSELHSNSKMALPSFMQHLSVLEQSGMVKSHKAGRTRTYQLEPHALKPLEHWLSAQRRIWETRLNHKGFFHGWGIAIDQMVEVMQAKKAQ